MTEKLLQYIWQFQYFTNSELQTVTGEKLQIISPGKLNTHQGPDFTNAQIKIDNITLAGSVELHLKTTNWNDHGHQNDSNYKNVVLHVVYENNEIENGKIPVLELQPRISNMLLERYYNLMNATSFISCASAISNIKEITWVAWKERLLAERLTRKSAMILEFCGQNNYHWAETFWWLLARNFGMKVNVEAFEAMARSVSTTILAKHKTQIHQLEALLLGQCGLLSGNLKEEYPKLLQREYFFLQKKYNLQQNHFPVHFLRMRPGNFPTIRLAQLAMLIKNSVHLFSRILEIEKMAELTALFDVTANDYWHYHYTIDEPSAFKRKTIGRSMVDNIIINTIVPMLFAYGLYHREEKYKSKALRFLEEINTEKNAITKGYAQLQIAAGSAFDSQALIELKNQYCDAKRCLECAVGNAVLKTLKSQAVS